MNKPRVWRGGSWVNNPDYLRSAFRYRRGPDYRGRLLGFRVMCKPKPKILTVVKRYKRKGSVLARPYVLGESLDGISVQPGYKPKVGDMIAQNPTDENDRWLISREYFVENYDPEE